MPENHGESYNQKNMSFKLFLFRNVKVSIWSNEQDTCIKLILFYVTCLTQNTSKPGWLASVSRDANITYCIGSVC